MKLMKKILVSAMAISAIAAFSTVAFAEDDGYKVVSASTDKFQVEYNETSGKIRLTGADALVTNDQMTLLVLNEDVDAFDDTNAKAEAEEGGVIVQIDQATALDAVEIPVGVRPTTEGSVLVIRVGGDAAASADTEAFHEVTVSFEAADTVLVGDADGSGAVTAQDSSEISKKLVNIASTVDENDVNYYAAAYADGDAAITAQDSSEVAKYLVNIATDYINKTVNVGEYGEKTE